MVSTTSLMMVRYTSFVDFWMRERFISHPIHHTIAKYTYEQKDVENVDNVFGVLVVVHHDVIKELS